MKKIKLSNILITINILFLIGCVIYYGSRMYKYYRLENPKLEDIKTLYDMVTQGKNIVKKGDGLYKEENSYYYKGKNVNNYLKYSGRLWRIVSVDNNGTLKLITEDLQTSLVWSIDADYDTSYLRSWLNDNDITIKSFYSSLDNTEILIDTKTCYDEINDKNVTCEKFVSDKVGTLSVYEYEKSGSSDGYLNIGSYWWTSNNNKDNKAWYVYSKGTINNEVSSGSNFYSYGVRPTITINAKISNFKGEGTKENPYEVVFDRGNKLKDKYIGEYFKFNNLTFKILEKSDDYVKLVLSDLLKENNDYVSKSYGSSNYFSQDDGIGYYLNNIFYKTLEKRDNILLGSFNVGRYDKSYKYDFNKIAEYKENAYVGLLQLGELFINDCDNYLLMSRTITSDKTIYQVLENGKIYVGNLDSEKYVRPVIYVNPNIEIKKGSGSANDPWVGEE